MAYPPIGDHALLGDGRTAALVTRDGCIDWLCWPDFDSPTLFAALLDARRGGRFTVELAGPSTRRYLPGTNVLETRFPGARLTDFLATGERALVRIVEAEARVEVRVTCTPRPGYGSRVPRCARRDERSVELHDPGVHLILTSDRPLGLDDGRISARFTLEAGERAWLRLSEGDTDVDILLRDTLAFWHAFCARLRPGPPELERAAIVLKTLSYAPTGALISAPTTSLPDGRGGQRNWDYRYAWLHDGAFSLWALDGAGAEEEARAHYRWLFSVARGRHPATVHALYGVRGEEELNERELLHLSGYRGSRPVRVGNAAAAELELDVFGELLDALFTFGPRFGVRLDDVRTCRAFVDWVAHHWRDPDQGLWEVRSRKRSFIYSRAGSWLALDRGLRLFPDAPDTDLRRWRAARDSVFAEVLDRGFDQRLGAFVQAYDSRVLDASALRLPLIGFLPAGDPRMRATVDQIERHLMPDGLVRRWLSPTRAGEEPGAWTACTFWLVEVMALQGRLDEAAALYRHALSFANDVGLLAEDIDAATRSQWGNFPCACAHLSLLSAAQRLEGRGRGFSEPRPEAPAAPPPTR